MAKRGRKNATTPGRVTATPARAKPQHAKPQHAKSKHAQVRRAKTPRQARIARERRALGANINYQHWIVGFQDTHAARTGTRLTINQVRRLPAFQRLVDTVLGHDPAIRHGPKSALARALVRLGVRDPAFKGNVGNSPNAKKRTSRPRAMGLARRGLNPRRNTP